MGPAGATALGIAVAFVAGIPSARAAEWSLAPMLAVAADRDTNRTLAVDPVASEGLSMSIDLRMQRATERFRFSVRPQLNLQRFTDPRFSRSDDGGVTTEATWLMERSSFGLTTVFKDQSTLASEIASTGVIDLKTRRRDEEATASWTFAQSERRALTVSSSFASFAYHGNAVTPLEDSQYVNFGATEQFSLSEYLALSLTGSGGEARTPARRDSTRFETLSIGISSPFTERMRLAADFGVNRRTDGALSSQGFVGQLSLSRSTECGGFTFAALRSVAPSGFGVFAQTDEVRISMQRALGPRLSMGSAVVLYRTTSAFRSLTLADRTYTQASERLAWQASETWSVATQVLWNRAQAKYRTDNQRGWQVRLESVWTPNPRSLSR